MLFQCLIYNAVGPWRRITEITDMWTRTGVGYPDRTLTDGSLTGGSNCREGVSYRALTGRSNCREGVSYKSVTGRSNCREEVSYR